MKQSLLSAIAEMILGRKYYANIVFNTYDGAHELSRFIFISPQAAKLHAAQVQSTHYFRFVKTVSFRSRQNIAL